MITLFMEQRVLDPFQFRHYASDWFEVKLLALSHLSQLMQKSLAKQE